ncbi:MAG: hypothetical protein NXH79_04760 [Rhodobacteraceae bacterium]|nr:hypothetical protein [Paracoccaceae bacterium]
MERISDANIIETIRKVVEAQLAPARVDRVDVAYDLDHDGDPLLRVRIVFEIDGDRLDPKAVRGLARHLREPLERIAVDDFPVFSFATVKEDRAAAA